MKKIALLTTLVLSLVLGACGSKETGSAGSTESAPASEQSQETEASTEESAAETEGKLAYLVGPMSGGAAWSLVQAGFEDACEELGWEGYYVAPQTASDNAQMVNLAETALTNGADALICVFMSQDAYLDVLTRAREQGVYVASVNTRISEEYQDFWIGTDPTGMGESQAKTLVDLVGDKETTVLYMQTNASVETQNLQFQVFSEYLKDYDNITVFGQDFSNGNAVTASDRIAAIRMANPEVNAIVCADSTGSSMGSASYVEENGLQDEITLIGIDASADILNYVNSNVMDATIAQDFYRMGHDSATMLADVMGGAEVAFDNDSGTIVIMPEDVQTYAEENGIELK